MVKSWDSNMSITIFSYSQNWKLQSRVQIPPVGSNWAHMTGRVKASQFFLMYSHKSVSLVILVIVVVKKSIGWSVRLYTTFSTTVLSVGGKVFLFFLHSGDSYQVWHNGERDTSLTNKTRVFIICWQAPRAEHCYYQIIYCGRWSHRTFSPYPHAPKQSVFPLSSLAPDPDENIFIQMDPL